MENKSFYVRQFRDMKESIDIPTLDWGQFQAYANTCAMILAKAHAQSPTAAMIWDTLVIRQSLMKPWLNGLRRMLNKLIMIIKIS